MEKLIDIEWENVHGNVCTGEAIVEYVRYDEDGKIVNEIINVFLPQYVPLDIHIYKTLKQQVTEAFHRGEGSTL